MDKQIEEMAKVIANADKECVKISDNCELCVAYKKEPCVCYKEAHALYNANCRILNENSVILTKEEYIKILGKIKLLEQLRRAITRVAKEFGVKTDIEE